MKHSIVTIIMSSIICVGLLSFVNIKEMQQGTWERLGSRKVNYGLDHDIIPVGLFKGTFTKLKIKVMGGSLNMHRMVVTYGNGAKDQIPLKHTFIRGAESRVIDLKGNKRIIKSITLWYDSKGFSRRRATFHIFGRH